jgi:hypothetical protein
MMVARIKTKKEAKHGETALSIQRSSPADSPSCLEQAADLKGPEREWFGKAIEALNGEGIPFLFAGAFGLYHYTGLWRGTKDLDVLILPEHRERAIRAVTGTGLGDLYDQEPYDREWIFRSTRDGVIVDLIWQLANKVDALDQSWMDRGLSTQFLGMPIRVVSAADLCWMKLFVFQRGRCDWPDIINVIRGTGGRLDWDHLLAEVGPHWRLLCALTDIFDWLCPSERSFIPRAFRLELEDRRRKDLDGSESCHPDLFDSRPWLTRPGAGCSSGLAA